VVELRQARYTALRDEVFESLQEAILDGRLAAGTRLVEAEVAAKLGVSKTPVREAIIRLERLGLVVSYPRRGTFVADVGPAILKEIFVVRALVEGYATAEAAARATEADLGYLAAQVDAIRAASQRGEASAVSAHDVAFHDRIYQISGNRLLLDIWRGFRDQILLRHRMRPPDDLSSDGLSTLGVHQELFDALATRDREVARRAAELHICLGARQLGIDGHDRLLAPQGLCLRPSPASASAHDSRQSESEAAAVEGQSPPAKPRTPRE
jgi:DNA-binding GntR family transcriptional regulator